MVIFLLVSNSFAYFIIFRNLLVVYNTPQQVFNVICRIIVMCIDPFIYDPNLFYTHLTLNNLKGLRLQEVNP